jgi:hypothetical protein
LIQSISEVERREAEVNNSKRRLTVKQEEQEKQEEEYMPLQRQLTIRILIF